MIKKLAFSCILALSANAYAYQDADSFLKQLDGYLTPSNLSKIITESKANEIARLAEEEDMEFSDHYLVSDQLLRLLRRGGVIDTEFGKLMEDFQAECDRLEKNDRELAIAKWKALWLEKASSYVSYVKGLKRLWAIDLSNTIDYDSNIFQGDPSDPVTSLNSGKEDLGTTISGGFTLRPFINHKKDYNWKWNIKLNGSSRIQESESSLEYNTLGLKNSYSVTQISDDLLSLSLSHEFKHTSLDSSADNDQHIISLSSRFLPFVVKRFYFNSAVNSATLQYRMKNEDATSTTASEDVDVMSLNFSQSYMTTGKDIPFQSLGWSIKYEQQSSTPTVSRDNSYIDLGLNYMRSLPEYYTDKNLNFTSSLTYRIKDWDSASSLNEKDQNQLTILLGLGARWTSNWSSNFNVSYLKKDTDYTTGGGADVDQWRVAFTNTFLTF